MRRLINYIKQCFCKHEYDDNWIKDGRFLVMTFKCVKCGHRKRRRKF